MPPTLFVFNPLSRLQSGLARVGEGDLAARVEVDSSDEFGELSLGFNRMAQTLQGLYQNLEARVAEKTLGLETERARLAALYEASAFVASATTLDALARGFAQQVRRVAQADASAVRWSDESNQRYLLMASDCLPQHLVDAEQCVPTGGCFCGQRAGAGADAGHSHPRRARWCHARPLRTRGLRVDGQRAGAPARTPGGRDQPLLPPHGHAVGRRPRAAGNAGQPPGRRH
jgi:nitrate/nitrite-specific signal transduction histidine kinase